jgi:hypothetical protein
MGLGAVLVISAILAQLIRMRAINAAAALNAYSTDSHANPSNLPAHIGHVDFDGPSGLAVPFALAAGGFVFVLGSAAGLLNLIPCSAWPAALAAGVVVGGITFLARRWIVIVKSDSDQGEGYKYPELHSHDHDELKEQIEIKPEKHTEK